MGFKKLIFSIFFGLIFSLLLIYLIAVSLKEKPEFLTKILEFIKQAKMGEVERTIFLVLVTLIIIILFGLIFIKISAT